MAGLAQMSVSPCVLDMYVQGHDVQGPGGLGHAGPQRPRGWSSCPFLICLQTSVSVPLLPMAGRGSENLSLK